MSVSIELGASQHNTSKFRAYASSVDKALKSFENTNDWPDLISALSKLGKVFSSNLKSFNEIPNSTVVSKRLSQCLHSALPAGVHLKALETYRQIFTLLAQSDNLAKQMHLFISGLFPLMDHCQIKVKSELISLIEQFVLPLDKKLRPLLPGLIAAVLHGLETGTDFYDRTMALLNNILNSVGHEAFFTSFWQAASGNTSVHLPALLFVNIKLGEAASTDQVKIICGGNSFHMVRALCAIADDPGPNPTLVQRNLLDFLCAVFPLGSISSLISETELTRIIGRCIFIVLRRDMSLNKRLYQWLLNKKTDNILSMNKDESNDREFLKKYSLPQIKKAIFDYLSLDTIEVPIPATSTLKSGILRDPHSHQLQYAEVRVCKLLHYFLMDRPELKIIVLNETIADLLEFAYLRNKSIVKDFNEECENALNADSKFLQRDLRTIDNDMQVKTVERRAEDMKNNFNALLNSLGPDYLWNFFEKHFEQILKCRMQEELCDNEAQLNHMNLFPYVVAFCLEIVQLDSHSAIRGCHIITLLRTILANIVEQKCDKFSRRDLLCLLVLCRKLFSKINVEPTFDANEGILLKSLWAALFDLIDAVSTWFCSDRAIEKINIVFYSIILFSDFLKFPFHAGDDLFHTAEESTSLWLGPLKRIVDLPSWNFQSDEADFNLRANVLDQLISIFTQSKTILGNDGDELVMSPIVARYAVKPFIQCIRHADFDCDDFFPTAARIVWNNLSENIEPRRAQMLYRLILRMHSMRPEEISSEIEDVIVRGLTSDDQAMNVRAIKNFHDMWSYCRTLSFGELPDNLSLKAMNRVIMVLLNFVTDDKLGDEHVELKALSSLWLSDCARHNDLHKILELLTLMLISPNTARVSIQNVKIKARLTNSDIPTMPHGLNCVLLSTVNGQQEFYHVCHDIDIPASRIKFSTTRGISTEETQHTSFQYIDCLPANPWIHDLNMHLLSPLSQHPSEEREDSDENIEKILRHNRTISDIPKFDEEDVDIDSISFNFSIDNEIYETVQYLIDCVSSEHEIEIATEIDEQTASLPSTSNQNDDDQCQSRSAQTGVNNKSSDEPPIRENSLEYVNDADESNSIVGPLNAYKSHAAQRLYRTNASLPMDNAIKRIRSGHRRQDSLQESIFSSTAHELGLFDMSMNICPGDYKQPLFDESFSHMLFYTENPSIVDLARAAKIFKTLSSMLKSSLGRFVVFCLISAKTATDRRRESNLSAEFEASYIPTISANIVESMGRHNRQMQGDGYWSPANSDLNSNSVHRKPSLHQSLSVQSPTNIPINNDYITNERNKQQTLFEIFSTVILYYLRSYYLNSPTLYVSELDLSLAWKCKIAALDCFFEILNILNKIVEESCSKEFATYVQNLYRLTKTQKVLLSLVLAAVPPNSSESQCGNEWKMPLAADICKFNNGSQKNSFKDLISAYHRSLLNMASIIVVLEFNLNVNAYTFNYGAPDFYDSYFSSKPTLTENQQIYNSPQNRSTIKESRCSLVELRLFWSAIFRAIKLRPDGHNIWMDFLIGCLPYYDRALATVSVHSVEQITRTIYECVLSNEIDVLDDLDDSQSFDPSFISNTSNFSSSLVDSNYQSQFIDYRIQTGDNVPCSFNYPATYALTLLESLKTILLYSMIDKTEEFSNLPISSQNRPQSSRSVQPPVHQSPQNTGSIFSSAANMGNMVGSAIMSMPTGILNNLFGRLSSNDASANVGLPKPDPKSIERLATRQELLGRFPSVLSILCDIWKSVKINRPDIRMPENSNVNTWDDALSHAVLNILNPIAREHQTTTIKSFGVVWMHRRVSPLKHGVNKKEMYSPSFAYSLNQIYVAKMVLQIDGVTIAGMVTSISDIIKDVIGKPKVSAEKHANFLLEISLLELLHQCVREVPMDKLQVSWNPLSTFFNDVPLTQLPARASFLCFMIMVNFIKRCDFHKLTIDKIVGRNMLEICQKLTDSVNAVVGWQLESINWLKKTLVVKQGQKIADHSTFVDHRTPQHSTTPASEQSSMRGSTVSLTTGLNKLTLTDNSISQSQANYDLKKSSSSLRSSLKENFIKKDPSHSWQALFLLAENLCDLVDSISKSDDKEKMLPTLQSVWNNTMPYLKEKGAKNIRFFLAGSQFLASLSSYNHTRFIWRKNALELILDNNFFKMEICALKQWVIVVDNLMTNDKSSFKEILTRISTSSTSSLSNLMTSRDAEYEMRAQHIKRLGFIIFSSDHGQYGDREQINDILERLTENLRVGQIPIVYTQVFICFRILLIRMKPNTFEIFWPLLYAELVQVLNHMEGQANLCGNSVEESKSQKDEHWMQLYLAACKLLEALCLLPAGYVPEFQLDRWVFIPPINSNSDDLFTPFSVRINHLLDSRYEIMSPNKRESITRTSLFTIKTLTSFKELHPFFNVLSVLPRNDSENLSNGLPICNFDKADHLIKEKALLYGMSSLKHAIALIEDSLYVDFTDHWQL